MALLPGPFGVYKKKTAPYICCRAYLPIPARTATVRLVPTAAAPRAEPLALLQLRPSALATHVTRRLRPGLRHNHLKGGSIRFSPSSPSICIFAS